MNPPPKHEWHRLFNAALDDQLDDAGRLDLAAALKSSPEARELWFLYQDNECSLAERKLPAQAGRKAGQFWRSWRPLTAAAAGVVIGVCSATAVWALASAKATPERELALVDGGFEQMAAAPLLFMPRKYGLWAGDPVEPVSAFGKIQPHSGKGMARYLAGAMSEQEREQNEASDLWQVIPLPGAGERILRIRAWFNAVGPAVFTLGAVAGADGPETAHALWNARLKDDPSVLAASLKTVRLTDNSGQWQMAELLLQVPGTARVLVIDAAAHRLPGSEAGDGFPGQFVDDVSVTIANAPALP